MGHKLTEHPALQLRLTLAAACLSYHEKHAAALSHRADEEYRAAKQELTARHRRTCCGKVSTAKGLTSLEHVVHVMIQQ